MHSFSFSIWLALYKSLCSFSLRKWYKNNTDCIVQGNHSAANHSTGTMEIAVCLSLHIICITVNEISFVLCLWFGNMGFGTLRCWYITSNFLHLWTFKGFSSSSSKTLHRVCSLNSSFCMWLTSCLKTSIKQTNEQTQINKKKGKMKTTYQKHINVTKAFNRDINKSFLHALQH